MKSNTSIVQKLVEDKLALSGFLIVLTVLMVAILAPYLAPYPGDVSQIHLMQRLNGPSFSHLFGTDDLGRDILSRVIFGTRVSFIIAFIAVGLCIIIGVPIGLYAGFYENWFSGVLMRIGDVFL